VKRARQHRCTIADGIIVTAGFGAVGATIHVGIGVRIACGYVVAASMTIAESITRGFAAV